MKYGKIYTYHSVFKKKLYETAIKSYPIKDKNHALQEIIEIQYNTYSIYSRIEMLKTG